MLSFFHKVNRFPSQDLNVPSEATNINFILLVCAFFFTLKLPVATDFHFMNTNEQTDKKSTLML